MTSAPLRVDGRSDKRTIDLTRAPLLGSFLRWKHARTAVQVPMLLLSAVILFDGFIGPQLAPRNLAGVVPWVHWRGFVVLALLVAGNLFCMACPFMLPRRIAKKILPASSGWPAWIPGKWLAIGLLIAFFWSYEAFDIWASPWLTAWVALAYFAAAFVIDGFFKGAAFCKHVCPIGQFHFVNSLASPFEVKVRAHDTCATCTTKDCISGRRDPATKQVVQNGCELWLFQERKVGNMDCTFCLDCVQACPHDNVGVILRNPVDEFAEDPNRSGIGRLSERVDIAALALVLVFGAFLNAFGMVGPVYRFERWLAGLFGVSSEYPVLLVVFGLGLVLLPLAVIGAASWASSRLAGDQRALVETAGRYSFALVPLGFGMWIAHYGFHFLTGALTIIPVSQSFLTDVGVPGIGDPRWDLGGVSSPALLDGFEFVALALGLAGALRATYAVSRNLHHSVPTAKRAMAPWAMLCFVLFAIGLWLMWLPMEMRGTVLGG